MKVALFVPGFSADEQDWCIPALLDYVRCLAQQAQVHVFTLRWPARRGAYGVYGARVHAFGARQKLGPRVFGLWAEVLREVAAEHRRAPFDVLHAFWADEPGWVAALAAARLRRPVVISLAGGEVVGLRDIGYGALLLPGRGALIRAALRRAARVTAGSHYLLRLAAAHLPPQRRARLAWAPLGVDVDRFRPAPTPASSAGTAPVLNVGSLYPVKNQALLLRALARLPAAALQIAGRGPLRPALEQLAAELRLSARLAMLGEVAHDRLPDVYRAAGLLVQASRHEAQGMAVLEAAACGLPVLGTAVGVLPEIAPDHALDGGDLRAALAAPVAALLADPARRRALGAAARAKVEAAYSLQACLQRFVEIYAAA